MKKAKKFISLFMLAALISAPFLTRVNAESVSPSLELRGVWISTVLNLDYPSSPTEDVAALKKEATEELDYAQKNGFNAVFFQVRPACDAFYKSSIFPWSSYLTGEQGKAPGSFDPLEFYVSEAHKRGLQLHAWINPFRVTKSKETLSSLAKSNPARKNPSWVVTGADGNFYLNPGIPEVRALVVNGVMEIIKSYKVDGIHLDDYFYPSKNFNDDDAFKKYGAHAKNLDEFRRNNINLLIKNLGAAIKKANPKVSFGVSPSGIWANKKSLEDGSDTSGGQSYFDSYADSRKWVKEKWVDYIAPQIYWNIGNDKSDYEVLVKWWNDTVADTGVKLYIGHAAYRWIGADKSSPWYGTGELTRQLSLNRLCGNVSGSIFFRLGTIRGNTAVSQEISDFFNGRQTSEFYVGRPSTDIQTTLTSFYVTGVSDPKETLTLNGKEVENRSASGFFGLLVKLRKGVNSLVFSQGDKKITRVIYSGASNPIQKTMPSAVISKSSVYPQSRELMQAVKTISLTCIAPAGSKVTVTINGRTLNMKQAKTSCPSDGKYYEASFSASYSVPQQKTGVLSLGSPVYRMTLGQKKDKAAAPGSLAVAFSKPSLLAEVTAEKADTYPYANSALGADGPLYKKMRDYVEVITGNYIKLSSGEWIKKSSVKLLSVKGAYSPQVTSVKYTVSAKEDVVHFETSLFPSAVLSFYDNKLTVLFPTLTRIVRPELPSGAICSDAQISLNNSRGSCVLTVDKEKLGGYYIKPTETGFDLVIRRKPTANTGLSPLSGITVMLDAGHGGSELGALGPMGGKCPEKTVNLSLALKLKSELELLGAKVLLTRGSDTSVTLYQRLDLSREKLPDLFLSLHSNSLSDDTDISKYSGASVYYREAWVDSLAQSVLKSASSDISRVSGGAFVRRHYITKATWAPSLILEAGFLPNPMDFEWLRDPGEQEKLAQSLAKCILQYFSN